MTPIVRRPRVDGTRDLIADTLRLVRHADFTPEELRDLRDATERATSVRGLANDHPGAAPILRFISGNITVMAERERDPLEVLRCVSDALVSALSLYFVMTSPATSAEAPGTREQPAAAWPVTTRKLSDADIQRVATDVAASMWRPAGSSVALQPAT
jgi:hypothetical protein